MIITSDDWMVIEEYMSNIHPTIRYSILPGIRENEEKILEVSERMSLEIIIHALSWHYEILEYIDRARVAGKSGRAS